MQNTGPKMHELLQSRLKALLSDTLFMGLVSLFLSPPMLFHLNFIPLHIPASFEPGIDQLLHFFCVCDSPRSLSICGSYSFSRAVLNITIPSVIWSPAHIVQDYLCAQCVFYHISVPRHQLLACIQWGLYGTLRIMLRLIIYGVFSEFIFIFS